MKKEGEGEGSQLQTASGSAPDRFYTILTLIGKGRPNEVEFSILIVE